MDIILEPGGICLVPKMRAPSGAVQGRDAGVEHRPSKQNLQENSSSEFVKPIVKAFVKAVPLYPALKLEPA